MHVFGAEGDIGALERFAHRGNVDRGHAYDDVAARFFDEGRDRVDEGDAFGSGVVHFPVACNNGFSHMNTPEYFSFPNGIIAQNAVLGNEIGRGICISGKFYLLFFQII